MVDPARTLTAHSLLEAFLELQGLAPDFGSWTEGGFAHNPPRQFRRRQLVALFSAFGLPWDPQGFTEGTFIRPDDGRYHGLVRRLAAELPSAPPWYWEAMGVQHLPRYFARLFRYRSHVERVLGCASEVFEASGLFLLAEQRAERMTRLIRKNVAPLDDALAAVISPEGREFTLEQLARDHGYPTVDLQAMSDDWY